MIGWMMMGVVMQTVTPEWVLERMDKLVPQAPWKPTFAETAKAIADASNDRPLFKEDDGALRTAAVLIAMAYYESRFQPNIVGDHGKSFGLFQIQPPTACLPANVLLLPSSAAHVALNLIHTSLDVCGEFPWDERLGWYATGGNKCDEEGRTKSRARMHLAAKIKKE